MKYIFIVCVGLWVFPLHTSAAVIINEVAWMGTVVSASDEWIELYNDGVESVSLVEWRLRSRDGSPSIALSGEIAAGGFYLLERTDDTTVPDQPADSIYTGDLANGGEVLELYDAGGMVIDIVDGSQAWTLGGNNTTKDTAQRQHDGLWITGVPTPKSTNTTVPVVLPQSSSGGSSSGSVQGTKKTVGGYKQIVYGYAGEDITAIAGARVLFEGYAVSDTNSRLGNARYMWAFGDGGKGTGKETFHTYKEPGVYKVVLEVDGLHQKDKDDVIVVVRPAVVHVSHIDTDEDGFIAITNDAEYEIDMSSWILALKDGRNQRDTDVFVFPRNTTLLPRTTVRFSHETTGLAPTSEVLVALQFPNGQSVEGVGFK